MQVYIQPHITQWNSLAKRPAINNLELLPKVEAILQNVQQNGDNALLEYARQFDGLQLNSLLVTEGEIIEAVELVPENLKSAIKTAVENITIFHKAQITKPEKIETMPGVICWRKNVAIEKIGIYIPGGTAPLFSTVLMLGVPAMLAGCKQVVLCTPPQKNGKIHPATLYAAHVCGISTIIKSGGAQAIAAMAFGTQTVPKVYKILGPGNQYVTAAKQLVQMHGVSIDMPAGPSEVCIMMDDTANPAFVAADLLSQAEHGPDSQVMLIANSEALIKKVQDELQLQLSILPRKDYAAKALQNSNAVVFENTNEAIAFANLYAAEHLIINMSNAEQIAESITNAGSIFLGNYSPESAGDYASGTNHTLPTNGFATAYSGVSMDSYYKKITVQQLTEQGLLSIADTVIIMAEAEGLDAHANAVKIRKPYAIK
jgi:histidinol dehydrogenase